MKVMTDKGTSNFLDSIIWVGSLAFLCISSSYSFPSSVISSYAYYG
jgi:hypothetical protein